MTSRRRGAVAVGTMVASAAALVGWPGAVAAQVPEVERVACDAAPAVFDLLCESYELITTRFVDEVADEALAAAAARGVSEAGLAPRRDEAGRACALPAPAFEQACAAFDAVADTTAAVWAASREMFASLQDPYTALMSPRDYEVSQSRLRDSVPYVGIGISIGLLDGASPCRVLSERCRLAVAEVFTDSPAERAGLMADDIVLELDGFVPAGPGCGLGDLRRFDLGSSVTVKVERDGRVRSFVAEADLVQAPVGSSRVVAGSIGYLDLESFAWDADRWLTDRLASLLDAGAETLVVDLRGNPGGFLETVINIAGRFLDDRQVIIQEVARTQTLEHLVSRDSSFPDPVVVPIAVAVDGGSASASEVLTLALRDHGRATVVGSATFGKNTGQITEALQARDGTLLGAARVTVFRWLGPAGTSAVDSIEPDVALDLEGCLHPVGLARQVAAAADLPGAPLADIGTAGERFDAMSALAAEGVFAGLLCQPGLLCPIDPIARWEMAVWLVRVLDGTDPEPVDASRFVDLDPDRWWTAHVERLAELGITVGCGPQSERYCPDDPVTRAQTATLLKRAFGLPADVRRGFADTRGNHHAAAIDALHSAGITGGCSVDPLRFCPDRFTTRAQMALFLERARDR